MGEGLEIFEGRVIPCPGEGGGGGVMITSMYANSVFIFLAIQLRPLETIDRSKVPIHSSTQLLIPVVGLGDEEHVWGDANNRAIAVASEGFGIEAIEGSLCTT